MYGRKGMGARLGYETSLPVTGGAIQQHISAADIRYQRHTPDDLLEECPSLCIEV